MRSIQPKLSSLETLAKMARDNDDARQWYFDQKRTLHLLLSSFKVFWARGNKGGDVSSQHDNITRQNSSVARRMMASQRGAMASQGETAVSCGENFGFLDKGVSVRKKK